MNFTTKIFFLFFLLTDSGIIAQPFIQSWQSSYNIPHVESGITGVAICNDNNGNLWTVGYKDSCMTSSIYIRKFDNTGTLLFEKNFFIPPPGVNFVRTAISDINGNLYVGASVYSTNTGMDYLVVKYDSSGFLLWTYQFDGNVHLNDYLLSLDVDNSGNVFIGGSTIIDTVNQFAYAQLCCLKPDGNLNWQHQLNQMRNNQDDYLTLKANGGGRTTILRNDYISAGILSSYDSTGTIVFETAVDSIDPLAHPITFNSTTSGESYISAYSAYWQGHMIRKYDNSGQTIWEKYCGQPSSILSIYNNVIYLADGFYSSILLTKLDTSGNINWSRTYQDTSIENKDLIALTIIDDRIFLCADEYAPIGHYNELLLQYDTAGNLIHFSNGQYLNTIPVGATTVSNKYFVLDMKMKLFKCDTAHQDTLLRDIKNYQNGNEEGQLVMIDKNGDLIVAGQCLNSNNSYRKICLIKYNTNGNILWQNSFPIQSHHLVYIQTLLVDNNNNYLVGGIANEDSLNIYEPFVILIDSSGQVLWQYVHTGFNCNFGEKITINTDNNNSIYISCVDRNFFTNYAHPYLIKINYLGDSLWSKNIYASSPSYENISNTLLINNFLYFILTSNNVNNYIIADTSGAIVHQSNLLSNSSGYRSSGQILKDNAGDFILYASNYDTICNPYCPTRLYVSKFDTIGNLIWDWEYFSTNPIYDTPYSFTTDENNNIYLSGLSNTYNTPSNLIIAKLSPSGQMLWADSSLVGMYQNSIFYKDGLVFSTTTDFDSAIAHIMVYDFSGNKIYRDRIMSIHSSFPKYSQIIADTNSFYFLSTINNGCEGKNLFCRKYDNTILGINSTSLVELNLFPNPANNQMYIELLNNAVGNKIQIYNLLGELIYSKEIITNVVDVSMLAPGSYLIQIFSQEIIYFKQFIKL